MFKKIKFLSIFALFFCVLRISFSSYAGKVQVYAEEYVQVQKKTSNNAHAISQYIKENYGKFSAATKEFFGDIPETYKEGGVFLEVRKFFDEKAPYINKMTFGMITTQGATKDVSIPPEQVKTRFLAGIQVFEDRFIKKQDFSAEVSLNVTNIFRETFQALKETWAYIERHRGTLDLTQKNAEESFEHAQEVVCLQTFIGQVLDASPTCLEGESNRLFISLVNSLTTREKFEEEQAAEKDLAEAITQSIASSSSNSPL